MNILKVIKENIIEILFFLGVIFISISAFLTGIRTGFLALGIMFVSIAVFALKGEGEK